jgi:hypothetical protein
MNTNPASSQHESLSGSSRWQSLNYAEPPMATNASTVDCVDAGLSQMHIVPISQSSLAELQSFLGRINPATAFRSFVTGSASGIYVPPQWQPQPPALSQPHSTSHSGPDSQAQTQATTQATTMVADSPYAPINTDIYATPDQPLALWKLGGIVSEAEVLHERM